MKKTRIFIFIGILIAWVTTAFADSFPPTSWISRTPQDNITIQNSSGDMLSIEIVVNSNAPNSAGVSVNNCGNTTHIDAGSSAICTTSDANNPVTFSSDSASFPALGSYVIKRN